MTWCHACGEEEAACELGGFQLCEVCHGAALASLDHAVNYIRMDPTSDEIQLLPEPAEGFCAFKCGHRSVPTVELAGYELCNRCHSLLERMIDTLSGRGPLDVASPSWACQLAAHISLLPEVPEP